MFACKPLSILSGSRVHPPSPGFPSSPVFRPKFVPQFGPLRSPFPSSCWKHGCGHPTDPSNFMCPEMVSIAPLPHLGLLLCTLVWLMRQKVSVPFIRDTQSREILAGKSCQAPHPFARKYPPWASLNRDSNFFDFLLAAHIRMSHMNSLALRCSLPLTLRPTGPA